MTTARSLAAAFGLSLPKLLGSFDLDTSSLKTSQASLFTTDYEELLENWPDSGMWESGGVYELQSSAPVILESECSSSPNWPTPVKEQVRQSTRAPGTGGKILSEEAANWPTARAEDGESCGNHPGATDSLTGATKNWKTPQSRDEKNANLEGSGNYQRKLEAGWTIDLNDTAVNWKTPHGMGNRDASGKLGGAGGGEFALQANQWQTPATDSFRSRGGARKDEMGLDQQARFFHSDSPSPQDQTIQDGPTSCETDPISRPPSQPTQPPVRLRDLSRVNGQIVFHAGDANAEEKNLHLESLWLSLRERHGRKRLSPRFVEFLMNFPLGHTEL